MNARRNLRDTDDTVVDEIVVEFLNALNTNSLHNERNCDEM